MFQQEISNFLSCKICSNELKNPLLLPCNHSFCSSCIEKLISSSKFKCPFCEVEFSSSTKTENLKSDSVAQNMIDLQYIVKPKIEPSKTFCDECLKKTEAFSFCCSCQQYFCQDHGEVHQKSKKSFSHNLVSVKDSINYITSFSSTCSLHKKPYEGFCKNCFELCCNSCSHSTHKAPGHAIYPFSEAKEKEEKQTLDYLIKESSKFADQIKTSIQEIDQMLHKAQERSSSLIKASNKFFFDLFQQILPEIQEAVKTELQKNERILQDQKARAEVQLYILGNELQKAKTLVQSNNIQGIVSSKADLFHLLSLIPSSLFVPQYTDNINLSCSDYIFNNPNEGLNLADQQLIVSSIVNLFNQLFGIKFTIPSLVQIEDYLKDKPKIFQQQKQRKDQIIQQKANKTNEDKAIKEKSKQNQEKKTQDFLDVCSTLKVDSFKFLFLLYQLQIDQWIGKRNGWQLLYKATRDGFKASDFHSKCDNQGPTVTIITSKEGYIFGGYTPISWNSTNSWGIDSSKQSFIFTLTNPHNIRPSKYPLITPENAIYCYANYGPSFGAGCDIRMWDQSNQNNSSYTNFPYSFSDTTGKGKATFTGNTKISTKEIEVFKVFD